LIEYGTAPREQKKTGRFTGTMPAFGVLRKTGYKMRSVTKQNILKERKE